ncbi:MAG: phosphatidate cytidylyltransferase [Defluviitaleaceae bacterium]|nr:phosphatidate cytidylyltransferase [Defluviitaleaceae bacterium]
MTFLKRSLTTVIGLPLVILIIYFGGIPLLVACTVVSLVGLREFYLAFSKTDKYIHIVGYLAAVGYFVLLFFGGGHLFLIALFIIIVQTFMVVFYNKLPISEYISTVYGFLYIPFLLSFVVLVREHELGHYFVWLIFTASFGCDTFAYITGSLFGKNKLVNSPSPSKSREGLIGGVLGATIIGVLYGVFCLRADTSVIFAVMLMSFFGAFFSIIGDLGASAVKRHCEIKDFGNLFPGHGGVVDRIDSVITVAPIVYIMVWLVAQ